MNNTDIQIIITILWTSHWF